MSNLLPSLRLTGADVLRDGEMQRRSVSLADGMITSGAATEVDLRGYLLLPGIIDMHGDGFEHHLAPRPKAPFPMAAGLAATDREAAAHGVTTAFLAQGWSWEGGRRGPDHAEALMLALHQHRPHSLTDLRIQIRAETHLTGDAARLLAAVRRFGITYVIFNNHLDEGLQMSRSDSGSFAAWAQKAGVSGENMLAQLRDAQAQAQAVPRHLCQLAQAFDGLGVSYGSHDDPDGETREYFAMIGARIAEFPLTRKAAAAAHAMMDPVLMGAPNVVRGGSQSGNVAASGLIADGLCDALVSDYYLPSLALAAWRLVDMGLLNLPRAWAMISSRPAEILRLADRGRLDPGQRADLVVVHAETRAVEATICGGRLSYASGEGARRFICQPTVLPMAAE